MLSHAAPRHRGAPYLLALLALCTAPAAAGAQGVLTSVSPERMDKILASMGLEIEHNKDAADDTPSMNLELGGYKVVLFLANKNTDAQLYVGFGGQKISAEQVNEWNKRHRFARAYRDEDGDAVLESDIDFTGGVTEANIKAWVKLFRDLTGEYVKLVRASDDAQSDGPAPEAAPARDRRTVRNSSAS